MEQSPALMWTFLLGAALAMDPRRPELIRCEFLHRANVTCYWKPGSTPSSQNTLEVQKVPWFYKANISGSNPLMPYSCTTSGTSCTAAINDSSVRFTFCITVTARGHSWNASSQSRCQSGSDEVILPPVTLDAKPVSGKPKCLNVTWSRTDFPVFPHEVRNGQLTSQIQFAAQGQLDVQVQNVKVTDYSMLVCLFRPDTLYRIRLRHQFLARNKTVYKYPDLYWSPWSNETWGRTVMDAPALWRQIKGTDPNGWRNVSLLWQANSRVLSYRVTCHTEGSLILKDYGSCKNLHSKSTSCSLLLPNGRCSCALTAFTHEGFSPEARTWLHGTSESEPPPPNNLTVRPLDNSSLEVRWTAPVVLPARGYVVEWYAMRERNNSILHWEIVNSSCTSLVITEGVKALERYAVSVRALYGERGAGQNRMVYMYTQQGAPSSGPKVEVKQIIGRSVKLAWSPVPVEMRHGFIRNYTLCYMTAKQPTRNECQPAHDYSHFLPDLLPGSYDIFMKANTDAGAGQPGPITNVLIGIEEVPVVILSVLPLILTFMLLVLLACLTQTKIVKKKLFQDFPDPSHSSLARWTPKTTLESMRWHTPTDEPEIKHCAVVLLGENEQQGTALDKNFTHHLSCSQLQLSGAQTFQNNLKLKNESTNSLTRAGMTPGNDLSFCPSIYSDILFSQTLQSTPKPPLTLSHLQYNDWQHSSISISDIKLGVDSDSNVSATKSASLLSQADDLQVFHRLQKKNQSCASEGNSLSSGLLSSPAVVKAPQKCFNNRLFKSFPSLQPDELAKLCDSAPFLPFSSSVLVDFSYCPVEYDPYISSAGKADDNI